MRKKNEKQRYENKDKEYFVTPKPAPSINCKVFLELHSDRCFV